MAVVQQHHLVTGGGGYPGYRLGVALHRKGHLVTLIDVRPPAEDPPEGVRFIECDIRDYSAVEEALKTVDTVYHMASFGMSGRDQLNKRLIEEVNITGTHNIIKACKRWGTQHLVYTSTYNVIFGGQKIENGDESLPYLPLEKHPDHYSKTKAHAEMAVLTASGSPSGQDSNKLHCCALRLAGVYGPGEQRHLPRIVGYMQRGIFCFKYGEQDSRVDFLHVDNLVQAHVLAGEALTAGKQRIASGQAYFISDAKPVNNFEFFRPLIEDLGYSFPKITIPLSFIYFIAFLTEIVHLIVGQVYNFQPLLTRTEVYKTGVTHYFSTDKARRDLGYRPTVQNQMDDVVKWFLQRGHHRQQQKSNFWSSLLRDVALVIIFVTFIMSCLPSVK